MDVRALAIDYDGTIAEDGRTPPATAAALARVRASGRRLVLVTGRILDELRQVCDVDGMFDAVVAENGAVLYLPARGRPEPLGAAPEPALVAALAERGVEFKLGLSIVATLTRFAAAVRAALRASGVRRRMEFNKDALMLLPPGITKGTGVQAALDALGVPPAAAAAIGDAENDEPLLAACGFGVAVADAVPALRSAARHVTRAPGSQGVVEFVEQFLLRGR
mgnify:CR=1 FL=1